MVAQVHKCRVTGVDADARAVAHARGESRRYRLDTLATFVEGDAASLPFASGCFGAVLCECATSLFPNKDAGFNEIARVLQSRGRLALSDVTFSQETLPPPLDMPLARALCIPQGMGPQAYVHLLESAGLMVSTRADCSWAIRALLEKAQSLLGIGQIGAAFGLANAQQLRQIQEALQVTRCLLDQGDLGYWAFIAQKP
jgi:ubiquinone/menaquinone biosynthesis C-methylase UbiE